MEQQSTNPKFPEQDEPSKLHGNSDESVSKMTSDKKGTKGESSHLTDRSGEEKKEDYINTDERKKDIDKRGL